MSRKVHSSQFTVDGKKNSVNREPPVLSEVEGITVNHKTLGFTVIEVMVVVTIFTLLIGFASINLARPQTQASLDTTLKTLVSDIRQQQVKAMGGDTDGTVAAIEHSIRFEANRYILFRGITYIAAEPSNFAVNLDPSLQLSTSFPSSQVVFLKRSGEVSTPGSNTVTLQNTQTGQQKIITINKYGATTIN